jgi:hypothetical protein
MGKYSPDEIANYLAKAENAKNNALWSIKRAYLPPQEGAPAAFILLTCLIDFLGTLYAGKKSSVDTFRRFVADYMQQTYNGVQYNDQKLYSSLRNSLVHNYSIGNGEYILIHGNPENHLKSYKGQSTILNLEDFFHDVCQAADSYFAEVKTNPTLQNKLSNTVSNFRTIEDVQI